MPKMSEVIHHIYTRAIFLWSTTNSGDFKQYYAFVFLIWEVCKCKKMMKCNHFINS